MNTKIGSLSFISACMVVFLHACMHVPGFIPRFIAHGVGQCAVPFFFVVSGFFLAKHCNDSRWWWKACERRCKTLGIPYLVWGCIGWAYISGEAILANYVHGRSLMFSIVQNPLDALGITPCSFPAFGVVWYVRTLFVLVLISPIIVYFISRLKLFFVGGLFCFFILSPVFMSRDMGRLFGECGLFALRGMAYFSAGASLRLCANNYAGIARIVHFFRWAFVLLGCVGCAIFANIFEHKPSLLVLRNISVFLVLLGMWQMKIRGCFKDALVRNSFPIYLIHQLVLGFPAWHCFGSIAQGWAFRCLMAVVAIFVSVSISEVLRIRFRRLHTVMFGGR